MPGMKKLLLLVVSACGYLFVSAQQLAFVIYSGATKLESLAFRIDQDAILKVSADGKILEWGLELERQRLNYYPGRLQPFMGRVDYYGDEGDSVSRGKVKNIGSTYITYYPASETAARAGKIKSIGRYQVDYYDVYENAVFRGMIRYAGPEQFTYYSSFENESFAGKLKSIGATTITYYSSFDDKLIRGKLKSIGPINYTWYTSNSATGYQGALKSGNQWAMVNGIMFVIM